MKRIYMVLMAALMLCVVPSNRVSAEEEFNSYFYQDENIISGADAEHLDDLAYQASENSGCGVYIVMVYDMKEYGYRDIFLFGQDVYDGYDYGYGYDRDGVMLVLSMADRDYCILAHGAYGNYAFTDYGKEFLEEYFLDDFKNDNWVDGLEDFIVTSESMLAEAYNENPIDTDHTHFGKNSILDDLLSCLPMGFALAVIFTIIYSCIIIAPMRNVHKAVLANEYVPDTNGVKIYHSRDFFVRRTVTSHTTNSSGGRGGTHTNSRGFSGRSGKF